MSALLDLPEIRRHLTPFSVEEHHRWGESHGTGRRTELTSESLDRRKAELYAEGNVFEYWLVLPEERILEVHTCPRSGRYARRQTHGLGETVLCGTVPGLCVVLDDLFRVA